MPRKPGVATNRRRVGRESTGFLKECLEMPQTINTNLASLNAQRNLNSSQSSLTTSMQRLSSGLRVNSAKDDAAGLAIAERMNTQVRGMNVAIRNANDGISLAQTAEGALGRVGDALQRMRELAIQARNATNSDSDKNSLNKEFAQLQSEVQRLVGGTTFNGKHILGADATTLTFQIGANTTTDDVIEVATSDLSVDDTISAITVSTASIGSTASVDAIASVITNIDTALDTVNDQRATFGATQSRFEAVISNLQQAVENQSAARSRIMDADFAMETANLSRAQILQQAGTAMVAQANQLPQQVLRLLQG
jgi:flagellin